MLSEVIPHGNAAIRDVRTFNPPSIEEMRQRVEEKRLEAERHNIIDSHRDDPVQAARAEAHRILAEAQEKARSIESQAQLTAAQKEKELRTRLERELTEKIGQDSRQLEKRLADSLAELTDLHDTIYRETQDELLNLTFTVIRKVIGDEVKTSPNIILDMLHKGFEKIKEASRYEIRVNSLDYDILQKHGDRVREALRTSGSLKFVKDDTVERGGCRILTETGEVSSEPGKQLEVIIKELQHAP
jgi:flagellar assembly protein FliH